MRPNTLQRGSSKAGRRERVSVGLFSSPDRLDEEHRRLRLASADRLGEADLAQLELEDERERRSHIRARTLAFLLFVLPALISLAMILTGGIISFFGR